VCSDFIRAQFSSFLREMFSNFVFSSQPSVLQMRLLFCFTFYIGRKQKNQN